MHKQPDPTVLAKAIFGEQIFTDSLSLSPQQLPVLNVARSVKKAARAFYFCRHDPDLMQRLLDRMAAHERTWLCRWFWDEDFGRRLAAG